MSRIETWPSYQREMSGAGASAATIRQPGAALNLPNAPHFEQFFGQQRDALQQAIRRGRERRDLAGAQGFGYNRQYRSRIEARIEWWHKAIDNAVKRGYSTSTVQAADMHFEPRWADIAADLAALHSAIGVELWVAFDEHLGQQALDALDAWPVDSGLSRALIALDVEPGTSHGEIMRSSVVAGAGYSGYIQEAGYRMVEITTKSGKTRKVRKYAGDNRLPPWKARYLVQDPGGTWHFDAAAYEKSKAADPDRRPAKGNPWRDLFLRPTPRTVRAIGQQATERAVKDVP